MAQAGYTPIQLYYSTTAAAVPTAGNLNSGELAINITDGKLYYKNNSGVVTLLAGATAGPAGGSNTQVQFNSSGVLAGSANMTFDGTTLVVNDLTDSSLTAGRVTFAGTAGNLNDSANLTWNGSTFSTTGLSASGATSLTGSATIFNSATNTLSLQNGGGAASILFGSNTAANAQITSVASGGLFFSTGDITQTEKLRITAAGDVGIGTSSPAAKLDVSGAASTNSESRFVAKLADTSAVAQGNGGGLVFRGVYTGTTLVDASGIQAYKINATDNDYAYGLAFVTRANGGNLTANMRLDGSGNLGLGVTPSAFASAQKAFQVLNGSLYADASSAGLQYNSFYNGTNEKYIANGFATSYYQASGQHVWRTAASGTAGNNITFTQAMTLDSSGNLGVGTSSPVAKLHVSNGSSSDAGDFTGLVIGGTALNARTASFIKNTSSPYDFTIRSQNFTGGTAGSLFFQNGSTTQMTLDSSGNLGIGTSSPAAKLEISGATQATGAVVRLTNSAESSSWAAGDVIGQFDFYSSDSSDPATKSRITSVVESGGTNPTAVGFAFSTYNTSLSEKMRLNAAGNLGLGVTPSAWGSGRTAIQINGSSTATYFAGSTYNNHFTTNYYTDGTNERFINGANRAMYYVQQYNGQHIWATSSAASSSAGSIATMSQLMTLDASGNLGVGATGPLAKINAYNGTSRTLIYAQSDLNFAGAYLGTATSTNRGASLELVSHSDSTNAQAWRTAVSIDLFGAQDLVWSNAPNSTTYAGLTYTQRMRLDASGNLGLGATPQAWNSDTRMIDVGASVSMGNSFGGLASLVYNAVQSTASSGAWKYRLGASVAAGLYTVDSAHKWYTAGAGTAGNAITFTQAMTLDASGNLGLAGQTSPSTPLTTGTWGNGLAVGTTTGTNGIVIVSSTTSSLSGLRFGDGGTGSQFDQGFVIYDHSVDSLILGTSRAERARIDSSGNLLLGTTSSGASGLTIGNGGCISFSNSGAAQINNYRSSNIEIVSRTAGYGIEFYAGAGSYAGKFDSSGNLLVGTTNSSGTIGAGFKVLGGRPITVNADSTNSTTVYEAYSTGALAYRFYVGLGGTVYATSTTITAISDQRLKENIRDLDDGLSAVMALKPRKFDWKEGKGANIKNARGFIAQEFETVFPDMIEEWRDPAPEGEEAYKAINANLIPTLVKAIQELKAEFDAYKASHP